MGISPRPTASEWLEQQKGQKKREMQEALISWERYIHEGNKEREEY